MARGYLDSAMLQYLESGLPPASVTNRRQGFQYQKKTRAPSDWEEYQKAMASAPPERMFEPLIMEKKDVVQMYFCEPCKGKRKGVMHFERHQGQKHLTAMMFICKKCGDSTNPSNKR